MKTLKTLVVLVAVACGGVVSADEVCPNKAWKVSINGYSCQSVNGVKVAKKRPDENVFRTGIAGRVFGFGGMHNMFGHLRLSETSGNVTLRYEVRDSYDDNSPDVFIAVVPSIVFDCLGQYQLTLISNAGICNATNATVTLKGM